MKSCLRIIAILVLLGLIGSFLQAGPIPVLVLAAILAAVLVIRKNLTEKKIAATEQVLGPEPLKLILDGPRVRLAEGARMLRGDTAYDFAVVGESYYAPNFAALLQDIGQSDQSEWDEVATLIADPANSFSKTAVAVYVRGLKLGHVPEPTCADVYRFLLENGGYARANCGIYFDIAGGKSSIYLDVARPYSFES